MNRVILTPAALPGAALAELKQWLGITTTGDDTPLLSLLTTALEVCEGFTGQMPLETECEEVLPARAGWHQHRERESEGAAPLPPASVAALWRPWRRMHLA